MKIRLSDPALLGDLLRPPFLAGARDRARALKASQIAWALDNGLSELRTGNDERNASARAVNANFAYTPLPDALVYRGPLSIDK